MELKKQNLKDRNLILFDDVEQTSIKDIIEKINQINAEDDDYFDSLQEAANILKVKINRNDVIKPINLLLGTYGGSVYDGLALYDVIKNSNTPIEITCSGKIMSMGIILNLASKTRKAYRNTTFMIHQVSSGMWGKIKDLEENVDETKRLNDLLFNIISLNTSISKTKLIDIYEHKKDWYITADEALDLGLITEII